MEDVETKINFFLYTFNNIYKKSEGRKIHEPSVMLDSQIREVEKIKKNAYNRIQIKTKETFVRYISLAQFFYKYSQSLEP